MKNMIKTTAIGAILTIGIIGFPTNAFADSFVALKDLELKDETGYLIEKVEEGNFLEAAAVNEDNVEVNWELGIYSVNKNDVLQVSESEIEGLTLKEGASLYDSPSLFATSLFENEVVQKAVIKEEGDSNAWVKISLEDGLEGWVHRTELNEDKKEKALEHVRYSKQSLTIDSQDFTYGEELAVIGYKKDFYIVKKGDKTYEMPKKHVVETKPKPIIKKPVIPTVNGMEPMNNSNVDYLLSQAKLQLGKPYVWGGNGEVGYDCSGFTTQMFKRIGIQLPRTAATQAQLGTQVSVAELQPGDLLFYTTYKPGPSHVAIYMGNGQMIQASGSKVNISPITERYWQDRFLYAKRIN